MKFLTLLMILSFYGILPAFSAQQIIFNITPTGLPPYMVKEEGQPDSGIMLDVLKAIADRHDYSVKTVGIPKKREVQQVEMGKIDAVPLAMEWVPYPEKYAFTDSIVKARDVLFSLKSIPVRLENI